MQDISTMPMLQDPPPVFSPDDYGTPDLLWMQHFSDKPSWNPGTRDVIVVSPHPDDELLGAGGLMRNCALTGHRVRVVSVTNGEAADHERAELPTLRRDELDRALRVLCPRALCPMEIPIDHLDLPDGRVAEHEYDLLEALCELLPPACTLIAPYEKDGHPDHDSVGRVCLLLARLRRLPIARYPVWTWHHSRPSQMPALRWAIHPLSAAASHAKARAVDCFESQLRPPNGTPILPPHVRTHFERPFEAFVL